MKHLVLGQSKNGYIQFFRYFFVGASSAVVDLTVYGSFLYFFGEGKYLLFAFFAYMVGLAWNHTLCLLWVFKSKHSKRKEIAMIIFIAMGGLFWTELFLWIGVTFFGGDPFFTKAIVLFIVLIWNFGMRKLFVFH